jgi:hypothetical protein
MNTPTLSEKAVLCRLSISKFVPRKTDRKITEEVLLKHLVSGTDAGKFVKQLLPSESIAPISKLESEWREFHERNTLPWRADGIRILPTMQLHDYNEATRGFKTKWRMLVDKFISEYPAHVAAARIALNGMFNDSDYPSIESIRGKFDTTVEFMPVPTGGDFRIDVAKEVLEEMAQSTNDAVAKAQQDAVRDLWQQLANPLLHLANKLADSDGKFRDSIIGNVLEIADRAPKLNVLDDPRLNGLAAEIRATFSGVNPDELRKNPDVRKQSQDKANEILSRLAGYV